MVGANSFLGRTVIEKLLKKNYVVEGVFHEKKQNLLPQIKHYNMEELWQLPNDYTHLYLISAYIPNKEDLVTVQATKLQEANVALPRRIVKHFSTAKVIYSSSVSVYGEPQGVLDEHSIVKPSSVYGKSKWEGEQFVKEAEKYAVVRISSMYGIGMKEHTFLPNSIKQALAHQTIKIWGNGSRAQNYIHVDDVANYLLLAADRADNGVYLAVDRISYTNLSIAQLIQQSIDCSVEMFGEDHSSSYYYQNQITNQILDYVPLQTLEQNLTTIIQWLKRKYS